jgi:hypothetical protein
MGPATNHVLLPPGTQPSIKAAKTRHVKLKVANRSCGWEEFYSHYWHHWLVSLQRCGRNSPQPAIRPPQVRSLDYGAHRFLWRKLSPARRETPLRVTHLIRRQRLLNLIIPYSRPKQSGSLPPRLLSAFSRVNTTVHCCAAKLFAF